METRTHYFSDFSELSPECAAVRLLGAHIVTPGCRAQIVELEAYAGAEDPGSHAHRGLTPRNKVMFDRAGLLYMYFNYGNHWMANVVCGPVGVPSALLIRAAIPIEGIELMHTRRPTARKDRDLLSGPGKLCAALGLDGTDYGTDLFDPTSPVRLEPGDAVETYHRTTRIGLSQGRGDDLPLRFVDTVNHAWSSRPGPLTL